MSRFYKRSSLKKIATSYSMLLAMSGGIFFNAGIDKAIANNDSSPSVPIGITSLETETVSATSSSSSVCNNNGNDCNNESFGTGDNIRLTGFSVGDKDYSILQLVDEAKFQRVDNNDVQGERHIYFLERDSSGDIVSTEFSTMEEAVRNEFINRGTDNVFANSGGVNKNNIERVDFLIQNGIAVVPEYKDHAGFLLLERGGNDPFKIAAITAVDSNGNPTAFGNLISVNKNTWGDSGIRVKTNVYQNESGWSGHRKTASLSSQNINGIFVSIASLGVNTDDFIYGYALFPNDINSSNDLVGLTDFPTDTSTDSGKGGLDLISSGGLFIPDGLTSEEVFTCPVGSTVTLTGTLRDFSDTHPDFEYKISNDRNIVTTEIGSDNKPVYANPDSNTTTTNGKEYFDQWYRDVEGVNQSMEYSIDLVKGDDGKYRYENRSFFPLDGQLMGNEERSHNYHFTFELHSQFTYKGGEVLDFSGDDDVWVYINGKRVVDLGGVHGRQDATVDVDSMAASLGLIKGQTYDFSFFFAERHTTQSNFILETNIGFTAPNAVNDSDETQMTTPIIVDVLANDTDPNGNAINTLVVESFTNPSNGTVTQNEDGTITYIANAGFTGLDTFTYTASDSASCHNAEDTATVTIEVTPFSD